MQATIRESDPIPREGVPGAVRSLIDLLAGRGHRTYLVGGCVRGLLLGERVSDFDLATSAPPGAVLELLPRSIPIGLRHGTVMVPTPDGPVDVTSFRSGPRIEDDLAHRDFTINAMAYDPGNGALLDPFGGRRDLDGRRLRAVGSAEERFDEDPLRALRAARLAATLELEVHSNVESAMSRACGALRSVARERIRRELELLLLAPGAARGLTLLRRSGIEAELAPGAPRDAADVVEALPRDLDLRLAGWLRGANAAAILQRLRFPRRTTRRVAHLLSHHPLAAGVNPKRDAALRRLIRSARTENLEDLIALRAAELRCGESAGDPEAELARLDAIVAGIARMREAGELALRRQDLAISGREVMEVLGCGPGRSVGRALRHLTERVMADPACNTPERLRKLLESWASTRADLR